MKSRNFKERIRSPSGPCVNAMGQRPYWPPYMEESFCTFRFGAIIWCNLHTLLVKLDSCEIHTQKATHASFEKKPEVQ